MSFFPRFPTIEREFTPLIRFLDDFDNYRNTSGGKNSFIRAFQPKFDVKEVKDAYELHGELPGIDQKDIEIEFTDAHTLVVKGRTEREYQKGTPPSGTIEGAESAKQIEGNNSESHKATVEDETPSNENTDVAKTQPDSTDVASTTESEPFKYWVSERSVGEFHRSFSFPSRVDQDGVKASMKNGILSIIVPKTTAPQSRKITIGS